MRVAVVGASGFVGVTVAEYFLAKGIEIVPLVGSTGNSWRLLSQGVTPRLMNVLEPDQVARDLRGCTHVVNCLRGSDRVMLEGMRNLLKAAAKTGVDRLIHISSVTVYGDFPSSDARVESAPPTAVEKGSYGWIKLRQDEMVQKLARRGLPSIILCPPNIIGPGSYYLLQILESLLRQELLLADQGISVCNTVDARNLAHACFMALSGGAISGDRYFVMDDEFITWRQVVDGVCVAGQIETGPIMCTLAELKDLTKQPVPDRGTPWRSIKYLVSSEVREALRKDPLIARLESAIRWLVGRLGSPLEEKLRLAITGPIQVSREPSEPGVNLRLSAQQLRGVWHSCEKAKAELGYQPIYTFAQSMEAFSKWLHWARGMTDADWDCRKVLFGYH